MPAETPPQAPEDAPAPDGALSRSRQAVRDHVREVGRLAEVVGALAKEFERRPRVDALVVLKQKVAALSAEWERTEQILSDKT